MTKDAEHSDRQQELCRKSTGETVHSERRESAVKPSHRSRKRRHDGHHHRREGDGEKEDTPSSSISTVATVPNEENGPSFFVDRKGDPQNVVYGGIPNGVPPRYRRAGYGSVMGVHRRYRISEDGSKASGTHSTYDGRGGAHASSLLTFRDKSKEIIEQLKLEKNGSEADSVRLQHDYIAVGPRRTKRRKRELAQGALQSALNVVTEGASRDEDSSEGSDTTSESNTLASDEENLYERFRNDIHRQRRLELNRATLEDPSDEEGWLKLIAYQDHLFDDYAPRERGSTTARQSLAELKLALYEKALTKVSDPRSRDRLTKGLMGQGAVIWDVSTLSKRWLGNVQTSSSSDLWISYANFRQSTPMGFTYEECLSLQRECLRIARAETDFATRVQTSTKLLLRSTILMIQSGYTERAIAVWQSLLEFTFFRPTQLDPLTERLSFQTFWESEVPRIGELGAVGWAFSRPFEVPSKSDIVPGGRLSGNGYEQWALRESDVAASSIMPARALDDVAENDPFRVILYSDIEEYLFRIDTAMGQALLINAFLKFCGLPPIHYPGAQAHSGWWGDEFLSHCRQRDETWPTECTAVSDTTTLFSAESSLSVFPNATEEDVGSKRTWQRTILKQLAAISVDDDHLAEYVIAYEASLDIKEGRKYAKSLLKSRSTHLRLYNAYALLECRLDRFESAEHVWSTAITMSQSASAIAKQDNMLLWSSWLFECLQKNNERRAMAILSSIPSGCVGTQQLESDIFANAAVRLRTRNYLESHLSQQLSLRHEQVVCHMKELLAIFEYLSNSHPILAALTVYNTTFEALAKNPASSQSIEILHQSRARLLHIHPTLSPRGYRPAEINLQLAESLCKFPNNSMFHHLYQEHTQRSGLLERIREVVPLSVSTSEGNSPNSSIVPYLFAIHKELCRPSYAGSTTHSIRAAFERGVAAAKASVKIWGWYIKWEVSLSNKTEPVVAPAAKPVRKKEMEPPRNRAVDVYYRGIRACSWAKELYMLAFEEGALRKAIGGIELRKVYDVMLEKGLRVHVDLEILG